MAVVVDDANNGTILVRPTIEPSLKELQDVNITSIANNQVLRWNNANLRWENTSALTTAESDIDALEGRMDTAEGDIDSLEGRMTSAENNIINIFDGTLVVPKALADQNGNVINTTYLTQSSASATYIPLSQKAQALGVATLGSDGRVIPNQLPASIGEILEFPTEEDFPVEGTAERIYVALDTNLAYRWSGTQYTEISPSIALGETSSTAFAGDRGLALETLTDNIIDGSQALALKDQVIRNTAVGTIPLVVNSIASTTANLTEFQVNGTKVLEVNKDGFLFKNGNRFVHNFQHPTGSTAIPSGQNIFVGELAGNLTMGSTATITAHSSFNTAVGNRSFSSNTTGFSNLAIGYDSLFSNTTGSNNSALGLNSLRLNTTGSSNSSVGADSLASNTTGSSNSAFGLNSGRSITTSSNNTFVGRDAGFTGAWGTQLATATNSTGIGYQAFTDKSNQMVFGNASVTEFKFDRNTGAVLLAPRIENVSSSSNIFKVTTLTNNAMVENINLISNTSGSIADGFGSSTNFYISLSDASLTRIGSIGATRSGAGSGRLTFLTNNAGSITEKMTILPNGNVGIGTSAPLELLHLQNTTNVASYIRTTGSTSYANYILEGGRSYSFGTAGSSETTLGLANKFYIRDNTGNAQRFVIDSAGNVGIGTSSPTNRLHIGQDFGLSISGNWGLSQFAVRGTTNTNKGLFFGFDTTNNVGFLQSGEVGVAFRNLTLNPNGGNVGIGTTSPSTRLEVAGGGITVSGVQNKSIRVQSSTSNYAYLANFGDYAQLGVNRDPSSGVVADNNKASAEIAMLGENNNSLIIFATTNTNAGTPTDRMRITGTGLVGINETAPSAQLQVKSGATNRVPLIVDTLASHATDIVSFRTNGSAQSRISSTGSYMNGSGANNSQFSPTDNGAIILRNVADTNPALIVNLANASATGNIQVWQKAGSALATITNTGGATFSGNISNASNPASGGSNFTTQTDFFQNDERFHILSKTNSAGGYYTTFSVTHTGNGYLDGTLHFTGTPSNAQTGDYTLVLTDKGKVLRINSSSNRTVTIPLNSSVAFPIDTEIAILRYGTGTVSISPTSGVTLNSVSSNRKVKDQYGSVALKKIGENEWVLVGSLEA
jgi:hypothetical protein